MPEQNPAHRRHIVEAGHELAPRGGLPILGVVVVLPCFGAHVRADVELAGDCGSDAIGERVPRRIPPQPRWKFAAAAAQPSIDIGVLEYHGASLEIDAGHGA